jgi:hypothetical protein
MAFDRQRYPAGQACRRLISTSRGMRVRTLRPFTVQQPQLCEAACMRAKEIILSALVIGLAVGYAWSAMPPANPEPPSDSTAPKPQSATEEAERAYYPNCRAAWDAGHAPIFRGQPGYREELDGDSDGIACEPIRT